MADEFTWKSRRLPIDKLTLLAYNKSNKCFVRFSEREEWIWRV